MSASKWLRKAATEIRAEGHNGWGNTCEQAADEFDALRARVSELEAAGRAVLNCNDQVCAFGHGGCPAQCRADEMLRKAIRCAGNKEGSRE